MPMDLEIVAKMMSDEQILFFIQDESQRERGFRLLMEQYQERLYWHIRRMVTEHEDANDVMQNTFIKVYRSIGRFKGQSALYTWLYRIATNEAITYINSRKKKSTAALDDADNNLENQLAADDYFDGDKAQVLLQKALSKLPEKQRLVFQLRYYEELSYQEMSEVLDTSVGALKSSYHHAVKKIETYFREVGSNL